MKPPKEFGHQPNELQIAEILCGLSEFGDYWKRTFQKHRIDELEMKNFISDSDLFYKSSEEELIGICTTYVKDALYAGCETIQEITKKTETIFTWKKENTVNYSFVV